MAAGLQRDDLLVAVVPPEPEVTVTRAAVAVALQGVAQPVATELLIAHLRARAGPEGARGEAEGLQVHSRLAGDLLVVNIDQDLPVIRAPECEAPVGAAWISGRGRHDGPAVAPACLHHPWFGVSLDAQGARVEDVEWHSFLHVPNVLALGVAEPLHDGAPVRKRVWLAPAQREEVGSAARLSRSVTEKLLRGRPLAFALLLHEVAARIPSEFQETREGVLGKVPSAVFHQGQSEIRQNASSGPACQSRHDLVVEQGLFPVAPLCSTTSLILQLCPIQRGAIEVLADEVLHFRGRQNPSLSPRHGIDVHRDGRAVVRIPPRVSEVAPKGWLEHEGVENLVDSQVDLLPQPVLVGGDAPGTDVHEARHGPAALLVAGAKASLSTHAVLGSGALRVVPAACHDQHEIRVVRPRAPGGPLAIPWPRPRAHHGFVEEVRGQRPAAPADLVGLRSELAALHLPGAPPECAPAPPLQEQRPPLRRVSEGKHPGQALDRQRDDDLLEELRFLRRRGPQLVDLVDRRDSHSVALGAELGRSRLPRARLVVPVLVRRQEPVSNEVVVGHHTSGPCCIHRV
mmetsp:Transcript_838/g.2483  ORF Transcript_838/g.2483 Transcript_838/m.2483 type:complete len:571 (+) Transcript_838:99-1811(+)